MQIQPIFNNFLATEFLDIDNNALSIYCKEKYKEQQESIMDLNEAYCKVEKVEE
jgi:hypothetical protein